MALGSIKRETLIAVIAITVTNLVIMITSIIMEARSSEVQGLTSLTSTDLLSVTQLIEDWNATPYIDIEIEDQECSDSVFVRWWGGTEKGCAKDGFTETYGEWKDRRNDFVNETAKNNKTSCTETKAESPKA